MREAQTRQRTHGLRFAKIFNNYMQYLRWRRYNRSVKHSYFRSVNSGRVYVHLKDAK